MLVDFAANGLNYSMETDGGKEKEGERWRGRWNVYLLEGEWDGNVFLKKKKIRLTYGNKKKKGKSYEEESRKNIYMYIRTYVSTTYT